ncbi:MAG: sigma 54-interacting transcriptional regulator [Planctomycetaceae bacterium]|nr:sigma 54-interacting transcriptional regulator [Planctomycetaceae bacterium]
MGIDADGIVNEVNRVVERLVGIPAKELLGTPIAAIVPNRVMVDDTLANGSEWFGEPVTIAGSLYSVNCVPVTVAGDTLGAVLTLQEPRQVQSMEQKMRKVYRSEGHTARRTLDDVIGESPVMRSVKEQARIFSQVDSTILIYGETGTGKELIAQGLHNASTRAANPFVAINCAALPESLLESELFGYVRGAFTGARSNGKMGLFEIANSGTIFLDEIGEMALPLQSRLLRVLEEKEIWRIGDDKTTPVDIRVVAATNRDLAQQVQRGEFREDLYYRLSVLILNLPPLRQRKDDLRLLANRILAQKSAALGRPAATLDDASVALLETLDWPGNIRQLSNVLERAVVMSRNGGVDHRVLAEALGSCSWFSAEKGRLPPTLPTEAPAASVGNELEQATSSTIRRVLADCGGNKKRAAKRLGISHTTLWRRLKELDAEPPSAASNR